MNLIEPRDEFSLHVIQEMVLNYPSLSKLTGTKLNVIVLT